MMPKHQCRCGVLFRSVQAIKRLKNRVVEARRSIFGTGFPSFSSLHQFEAQAAVVIDPHDVVSTSIDSMGDFDFVEDYDLMEDIVMDDPRSTGDLQERQPAIISSSPLIQEDEPSDCTDNFQNQTSSSPWSDSFAYNSSPGNKWTLSVLETSDLCEVNKFPNLSFPDILPVEGVISTKTLATTASYHNYNYSSDTAFTAPQVTMVQHTATAYYGMGSSNSVTGSSMQNYDLMSQMLMRDGEFQITTTTSPRRWCVLKLIVWACKRLRFLRLTLLTGRGPSQSLVTTACQQGLKRRQEQITEGFEGFEGVRRRKNKSGKQCKQWVAEIRMTTKTNGPEGGKVWLGSFFTCEEAARAYDVGRMFCSKAARSLNFPESRSILAPYKDMINQLPIDRKKKIIQAVAKQYGETSSINASHFNFLFR